MKIRILKSCQVSDNRHKAGDIIDVNDRVGAKLLARKMGSADLKSDARAKRATAEE